MRVRQAFRRVGGRTRSSSPGRWWSLLAEAGVLGAVVLAACSPASSPPPTARPAAPTAPPQVAATPVAPTPVAPGQAAEFDRLFIDMMVPHHEGAIEMARIAQQRAERPEIKHLAEQILRTQDAEISRMRRWRQEWYGSGETPPMTRVPMLPGVPGMGGAGATGGQAHAMDMAADVQRLRTASAPFDLAFIEAMIPHHQSAVEAARVALQQSGRQEITDLALDIVEAQLREIGELRAWRLTWYGSGAGVTATVQPAAPGGHDMPTVPGEDMTGH